ncbi:MAG: hypothetical protein AAGA30_08160 [Planctomycetota bacterium]
MPIYKIESDGFRKVDETSFSREGLRERQDLQRLLKDQIEIVSPNTLIIGEEFGQWEDSRRRIDLLGIDKNANLVVIELKRTEDGGHMELQAIRYAAMVSAMTFERVIDEYEKFIEKNELDVDARETILEFLEWEEPNEDGFAQDVRIVLVSAEFSVELTTAVIWLNERNIDVRCIRIKPYQNSGTVLVDIQQIIPLPEAEDYQVRLKEKQQRERADRKRELDLTKYDLELGDEKFEKLAKRRLAKRVITYLCQQGKSPEDIAATITWKKNTLFRSVDGIVKQSEFTAKYEAQIDNENFKFDPRRYFTKDDDLIYFDDRTYSITNGWGARTYEAMQLLLKRFPDMPIKINPLS